LKADGVSARPSKRTAKVKPLDHCSRKALRADWNLGLQKCLSQARPRRAAPRGGSHCMAWAASLAGPPRGPPGGGRPLGGVAGGLARAPAPRGGGRIGEGGSRARKLTRTGPRLWSTGRSGPSNRSTSLHKRDGQTAPASEPIQ